MLARCSTAKQKENLERQKDRLRKYTENKGYKFILIVRTHRSFLEKEMKNNERVKCIKFI